MAVSWIERAKQFKSPLTVVLGFLFRSRETQIKRGNAWKQECLKLRKRDQQSQKTIRQYCEGSAAKDRQIDLLKIENEQLRKQPPMAPDDPPLPHHEFGPKMISLCVNMVKRIGLRPVPDVLEMVFESLGVSVKIPCWTTVRTWALREGVAAIERPIEQADDWIWLADHSNQIGTDKVFSIVGLRDSKLPPPGEALKHEDIRVLHFELGTDWKCEDVARAYGELAERCGGPPLALVTDGAIELREGAEALQKGRKDMLIFRDFKHFAANVLKKVVGGDEQFAEFKTQLGRTRSSIQQTELAHFTPVRPKPKARFMNLAATLKWANMVSWHLSHAGSKAREGITAERMNEKLGWLRTFRGDMCRWSACQDVVSVSSTFINKQGLSHGVSRRLRDLLRTLRNAAGPADKNAAADSRKVAARLLELVRKSESQLEAGQRLPMSTEILESSFGLFKQLEGQHSKGGFTSLLAAYGCLLHKSTPESIRRDFAQVSVKHMQAWVADTLGETLASKRKTAYQEFRIAT